MPRQRVAQVGSIVDGGGDLEAVRLEKQHQSIPQ
jgi:hypothetical protein